MRFFRCRRCGEEFEQLRNEVYCHNCKTGTCAICGKNFKRPSDYPKKECCCRKCSFEYTKLTGSAKQAAQKGIQTKFEKYGKGSVHLKEYTKVCKFCGKEFIAHSPKAEVCKDIHTSVCVICGKEFIVNSKSTYISPTCSRKCGQKLANKSREQTSLKHYGVTHPMKHDTVKQTLKTSILNSYGVDNASKSEDIKQKIKSTFMQNYGVDNPMKVDCLKEKQANSMEAHYGHRYAVQVPEIRSRIECTNVERYGSPNVFGSKMIREKILSDREHRTGYRYTSSNPATKAKISAICQERYGVLWSCMRPECRQYTTISKINMKFSELLDSVGLKHEMEFNIGKYSYDFHILDSNILVEINPTITHNSYLSIFPSTDPKLADYHLKKSQTALDSNYRCIHVWDWDNWEAIIQLLLGTNKIYARNCEVVKLDQHVTDMFVSENHISGSCKGQSLCYGLYHDTELVEVMTFGKPRYNYNYKYELLRLCSLKGTTVVGGASKLFHRFLEDNINCSVISYCDRSKFLGTVYENIGMQHKRSTPPNKIWSKGDKRVTQNLLNQRGFDQLFNANYGKHTNNEELMLEHGWLPVFDCGQLVYTYEPEV